MTRLPIACYGTLRKGQGNAGWAWQDGDRATCLTGGLVPGFRLVTRGWFPYAIPDLDSVITVDVIVPEPACYDDVMAGLDGLEGYPVHYDRRIVTVVKGASDVSAWLYVPTHWQDYADLPAVTGNDWLLHQQLHPTR